MEEIVIFCLILYITSESNIPFSKARTYSIITLNNSIITEQLFDLGRQRSTEDCSGKVLKILLSFLLS